jgi:hypothetical protein
MSNVEFIREERSPSEQEVQTALYYINNKIWYINNQIMITSPTSPTIKVYKKELFEVLSMKKDLLETFLEKKKIEK